MRGEIQPPPAGGRLSVFTLVSASEAVELGRDAGGEIWNKPICSRAIFFLIFVATFLIIFPIVTVQKFLIGGLRQRLETTERFHWKSELSAKPQDVENHRRHFYLFTYVLYSSSCVTVCV